MRILKGLFRVAVMGWIGYSIGNIYGVQIVTALGFPVNNCIHWNMEATNPEAKSMLVCYIDEKAVCKVTCVDYEKIITKMCALEESMSGIRL